MKNILLVLLIFAAGCAKPYGPSTTQYRYILEMFNADLMKLGYIPIDFSATDMQLIEADFGTMARCYDPAFRFGGPVVIGINKDRFGLFPEYTQIGTIYHEIGHCFFNLRHDETRLMQQDVGANFSPAEIMNEQSRLNLVKEMAERAGF
jgi:hypothetical protein